MGRLAFATLAVLAATQCVVIAQTGAGVVEGTNLVTTYINGAPYGSQTLGTMLSLGTLAGQPVAAFLALANRSGLLPFLSQPATVGGTRMTLFIPPDAAVYAAGSNIVAALRSANASSLSALLSNWVVNGALSLAELRRRGTSTGSVYAASGAHMPLGIVGGGLTGTPEAVVFGSAVVTRADIAGTNGIIHLVDRPVITQDFMLANAPTLEQAPPPSESLAPAPLPTQGGGGDGAPYPSLLQRVREAPQLSRLAALLGQPALVNVTAELGTGIRPLTLLAPIDDAFSLLPEGLMARLTPTQLAQTVAFWVLRGRFSGDALRNASMRMEALQCLGGGFVTTQYSIDGSVFVEKARLVTRDRGGVADVPAASGSVLQSLDRVILPFVVQVELPVDLRAALGITSSPSGSSGGGGWKAGNAAEGDATLSTASTESAGSGSGSGASLAFAAAAALGLAALALAHVAECGVMHV